jgi:Kef-type K+ transport system membrane component KefB
LKSLTYGFFAPLFFVWVGLDLDINYLITYPLLVLLVVVVSKGAKLLGSIMVAKSELGMKGSILLGVGLSVRFSTSIIIIKFLYNNGVIGFDIYSVVVASSIVFKFIVPILFSQLVSRWNMSSISSRKLG